MTARITVVTGGHLSTCPRMLKTADALHEEGYRVRVVSVRHTPWATAADLVVRSTRTWRSDVVDYGRSTARLRRISTGIRYRGAGVAARALGPARVPIAIAMRACSRAHDELVRLVAAEPCDLVYGGTLEALGAVAEGARRLRVPYALDLEDFHSGEQDSPAGDLHNALAARVERDVLPDATFLTAGSSMIADAYAGVHDVRPTPIHNTFPVAPVSHAVREHSQPLRLYWFSQTLGAGRGLNEVVRAFGRSGVRAELHLRGRPVPSYAEALGRLQRELAPQLSIVHHDLLPPDAMVMAAQPYDAGLSCEEPGNMNKRLCLGNKVFTYLSAGVPVILSRTPAQTALAADLGPAALTYGCGDVDALAAVFCRLAASETVRGQARYAARAAAMRRWHWEHPLDRGALVGLVRRVVA